MQLSHTRLPVLLHVAGILPLQALLSLTVFLISYNGMTYAGQTVTAADDALAYNDDNYALSELNYLADIPLVSAATRLPQQRHESPAAITVLDRAVIEASSALTIPDLFRLVPGMITYHTSTNTSAVSYHGMSDRFPSQMEVMVDGRSIYIPLFSTVLWDTLGLTVDDIDRIEVVRGSNSATHGSNAFTGAINIITRSGLSQPGSSLKYTAGSMNTRNFEARHSGSYSLGNYALSAGNLSNDGSDTFEDKANRRYLNFNTVVTPNLQDTLTFNLGFSEGFTDVGDLDSAPVLEERTYHTNSQHIKWQRILQNEAELEVRYAHNYYNLDADKLDIPTVQQALELTDPALIALIPNFIAANPLRKTAEVGDIEQHELEMTWRKQASPASQFIIGSGYKFNRARSLELLDTQDWVSEERTRVFGNWEYSGIRHWVFNAGAMIEHTTAGKGGTRISPRLAANYQLTATSGLRSSVSQAYRMPSLLEANLQTVVYSPAGLPPGTPSIYQIETLANPDIEPERLRTLDVGYFKNWPEYNSQMDLRLFYERIDNGIATAYQPLTTATASNDTRYRTEDNGAEWNNRGFETQIRYQPNMMYNPLILFNYSYIHVRGFRNRGHSNVGDADSIDRLENRTPMHTASLLASITLPDDLQLSVSHFYMSEVKWLEGSSGTPNEQYNRTDLKISKGFKYSNGNALKLNFIVHNLLDDQYQEFYADNLFDRRAYVQLELSF